MLKQTPLAGCHDQLGAKRVAFAGWEMPIQYTSIMTEHQAVRQDAGIFDVSHMCAIDIKGDKAQTFLRYLLANDVAKLQEQQALYTCMLNENGGILDDLIVYHFNEQYFRLVVNAGTTASDYDWIVTQALPFHLEITLRDDLAMLAIQGPNALRKSAPCFPEVLPQAIQALKPFTFLEQAGIFVARTGYTGEDGIEVLLPKQDCMSFWEAAIAQKITPIGLGARDTLRLEAGLNLYGQDMDLTVTPLEANLAWTVDLSDHARDFIGKQAVLKQKESGQYNRLIALVLERKGVIRSGMLVYAQEADETSIGKVTSGTFSPTLQQGIAFARVAQNNMGRYYVDIRGNRLPMTPIKSPFVKKGRANF